MPRASKADTPVSVEAEQVEFRNAELDGYTVTFGLFKTDSDPTPLFRGLPDDRCQSPHWGVIVSGKITFRYPDHDETYVAGDAFHAPPGHVPLCYAGTEVIEFSPTDLAAETDAVVAQNMMAGVQPL